MATTSRCAAAVASDGTVLTLPPYGISRTDDVGPVYVGSVSPRYIVRICSSVYPFFRYPALYFPRPGDAVSPIDRCIVVCRNGPSPTSTTCGFGSTPATIAALNAFISSAAFGAAASIWVESRNCPADECVRMNGA